MPAEPSSGNVIAMHQQSRSAPSNHPEITEAPSPRAVSRHRILAQTRLDFWLDAALHAAFVLAYSTGFTGLAVREWLGLGLVVVAIDVIRRRQRRADDQPASR
jgi:hypothetical protein